jgi:hypothetical protein
VRHHVLFAYTDFSTRANLHLLACPTYIQKGWPSCSVLPTLGKIFPASSLEYEAMRKTSEPLVS